MTKRIWSILLALCMVLTLVPVMSHPALAVSPLWPVPGHYNINGGLHGPKYEGHQYYNAIDIQDSNIAGATVIAAMGGTVSRIYKCAEKHPNEDRDCLGFGTGLVISGDDGKTYQYAHMMPNSIPGDVYYGAYVSRGQVIGQVGESGRATGYHLHFGISNTSKFWEDGDPRPSVTYYEGYPYGSDQPGQDPVVVSANFSTSCELLSDVYGAKIATRVTMNNTTISTLSSAGAVIYDRNGTEIARKEEPVSYSTSYMDVFYEVGAGKEINVELRPGTVYQYKFFVRRNGGSETYVDEVRSFTTAGTATVSVALDPNGGTVSQTQLTAKLDEAYGTLPTPMRSGYRFGGWYTAANGGSRVTADTTASDDVTRLYAHWQKQVAASGGSIYIDVNRSETEAYVVGCDATVTSLEIPAQADGKAVAYVAEGALKKATALTSLTFPDTIRIIYESNLNLESLKTVYIPGTIQEIRCYKGSSKSAPRDDYSACEMDIYFGGSEESWNAAWKETRWFLILPIGTNPIEPFAGNGDGITVHFNAERGNAHQHSYRGIVKPASCTEPGTITYVCGTCGDSYVEQREPAKGHSWGGWTVVKPATVNQDGLKTRTCDACGATEEAPIAKLAPQPADPTTKPEDPKPAEPTTKPDDPKPAVPTPKPENPKSADPTPSTKPANNPFEDVHAGDFFYDPVLWALNHDPQITDGMTETTFAPDDTCTRGQVVTFLWRSMGCAEPQSTYNPFVDDVSPSDYFYKAVLWAIEKGITDGTSDTTFSPNDPCTRAHVVTFLWRSEGRPGGNTGNPFADVGANEYYTGAVLWAVSKAITDGTSETTFSPDAPCTRGQIVTFLYRDMK